MEIVRVRVPRDAQRRGDGRIRGKYSKTSAVASPKYTRSSTLYTYAPSHTQKQRKKALLIWQFFRFLSSKKCQVRNKNGTKLTKEYGKWT